MGDHLMRFHVVSLPHTQTTSEYIACAYTQKVIKFCRMMRARHHDVFLYSGDENEAACTYHTPLFSRAEQVSWYGEHDRGALYNQPFDAEHIGWKTMNERAVQMIARVIQPRDFICLIGGTAQEPIAAAFPDHLSVEYGIGYSGVFSPYRVFESYAWMHYVQGTTRDDNGHFFDAVIPNYYDPDDFTYSAEKDDYLLFIGRFVARKGVSIAVEVAARAGLKLVMAGQGVTSERWDVTRGTREYVGEEVTARGPEHLLEHVGPVDAAERAALMAHARAVIVPTTYLEPFGGVAVEAMMCGTPVIASDFGAFPEYVHHGYNGFRFRTLSEAVWGVQHASALDPATIHRYAVANFSLARVSWLYDTYFRQLSTLWGEGWYCADTPDPLRYISGMSAPVLLGAHE